MNTTDRSASGNERLQSLLLRIAATVSLLTLAAVVVPHTAMQQFHRLLGLGLQPESAVLQYLAGGGAYVYGMLGVLLWIMAGDVVRYRPLIVACGWIYLLGAPGLGYVGVRAGMPMWWTAVDVISCLGFGAALLWSCRGSGNGNKRSPGPNSSGSALSGMSVTHG